MALSSSSSIKPLLHNLPSTLEPSRCPNSSQVHFGGSNGCLVGRRGTPFSSKCCTDGSSASSMEEDSSRLVAKADWRSFRSELMASENGTKLPGSSRFSDFVTKVDHHTHIDKDKKWAHILHAPETGCLLIAMDKLNGDNIFNQSVVLLLSTGRPTGSLGVILNRPLNGIKSSVQDDLDTILETLSYYGGPSNEKMFLVGLKDEDDDGGGEDWMNAGFEQVVKGFYYGTSRDNIEEMVGMYGGVGIKVLKLFDGCCRWEQKKLEEEVRNGYWKVIACSPSVIGSP